MDIRTTQELMGHADINMTMRYAHLSPDHKRGAMEAMESQFSGKSAANFHNTPPKAISVQTRKSCPFAKLWVFFGVFKRLSYC